jgi:ABC-type transport system involved in cytochrome c biogenesis permease subunit
MNNLSRYFPWFVVAAAGLYLIFTTLPPAEPPGGMHLQEFGNLPVVDRGRVKPLDTLARTSLMLISRRQEFTDGKGKTQPAIKWLLDVATSRATDQVLRVEDERLREMLGLPDRADAHYSFDEISTDGVKALAKEMERLRNLGEEQLTPFDQAVLNLVRQVRLEVELNVSNGKDVAGREKVFYIENDQVLSLLGLEPREGFRYSFDEIRPKFERLKDRLDKVEKTDEKQRDVYDQKVVELSRRVELYLKLQGLHNLLLVPPQSAGQDWEKFGAGLVAGDPAAVSLRTILRAYGAGKAETFNSELASYRQRVASLLPKEAQKAEFEVFFNQFAPFYQCSVLYVLIFLVACLAWIGWSGPLNRAAFWLLALTLAVHTWALGARMYIQDRPPVTNLYSSAVFIGWACAVLCLVLEAIFRIGIGNVVAAVSGSLTVLVAHHLAEDQGDTLEMMQAVLDTNFWLATHVTCVTFGYAATFVAGLLGILYIVAGLFTPALKHKWLAAALSQALYGVVCFATFLSFTGTVLGGIWADQSWGRFWGWDPKENGALLIVIWNALILHARWGGMVKQRGMAVLAVVGGIVTGWSWFGTNQLRVGLHSYGFNDKLATGLVIFWLSQLVFIAMGLLPLKWWRSFAPQAQAGPRRSAQPGRRRLQPEA